jgi:hypothetical protein
VLTLLAEKVAVNFVGNIFELKQVAKGDAKEKCNAEASVGEEWIGSIGDWVGVYGDDVFVQSVPGEAGFDSAVAGSGGAGCDFL